MELNYERYVQGQLPETHRAFLKQAGFHPNPAFLARVWSEYVNYDERVLTEAPFLDAVLRSRKRNCKAFDVCLGSGATTFALKSIGITTIFSNEIDQEMRRAAFKEAKRLGIKEEDLHVFSYDWRELGRVFGDLCHKFDVVTCLGNSLTYLFREGDRLNALGIFRRILRRGGTLLIDERNYPALLKGQMNWSGKYVYCGKDKFNLMAISNMFDENYPVIFRYTYKETGEFGDLAVYPFKENEL